MSVILNEFITISTSVLKLFVESVCKNVYIKIENAISPKKKKKKKKRLRNILFFIQKSSTLRF